MSDIRIEFRGPLDDYAELLRELHNHNVQTDTVTLDIDATGENAEAVLRVSSQEQFLKKVLLGFTDRPSVKLSVIEPQAPPKTEP